MLKNPANLIVGIFVLVFMSGCATSVQYTNLGPPPDTEDGTYVVNIDTKERCSGPVRAYDFLVTVQNGTVVDKPQVLGKHAITGTCQQALVSFLKGVLPSFASYLGARERAGAIEEAAATAAAAGIVRAKIASEAMKYRVDNTKPPIYIEDNDVLVEVESDTNLNVDTDVGCESDCDI